ncbi:hypothetical protein VIBNIAM115_650041 [Vibrio nigripulchritudo AM115]|nr:hypothetical protein VIBNIAM115_650041 [Vibrio nigripulchritudo AM115]
MVLEKSLVQSQNIGISEDNHVLTRVFLTVILKLSVTSYLSVNPFTVYKAIRCNLFAIYSYKKTALQEHGFF